MLLDSATDVYAYQVWQWSDWSTGNGRNKEIHPTITSVATETHPVHPEYDGRAKVIHSTPRVW